MPLSRSPLANCSPLLCVRGGGIVSALDRSFLAPAESWWRGVSRWLFGGCVGPRLPVNIANSSTVVHNDVCNGVVLEMINPFKIK